MSRLLLDTTFLIDGERGEEPREDLIAPSDDVAIAAITAAELLFGVEVARGRNRASRAAFVNELLATVPVVPYDLEIATEHALLLAAVRRSGRPRGAHDLMIAATATATGRIVVTADAKSFEGLPGIAVRRHR